MLSLLSHGLWCNKGGGIMCSKGGPDMAVTNCQGGTMHMFCYSLGGTTSSAMDSLGGWGGDHFRGTS